MAVVRHLLKFVRLSRGTSIMDHLKLDEALMRTNEHNWCVISEGSPSAVVLGLSGRVDALVHGHAAKQDGIPLIRRFSGGGTVFIDPTTQFVSLIANASHLIPLDDSVNTASSSSVSISSSSVSHPHLHLHPHVSTKHHSHAAAPHEQRAQVQPYPRPLMQWSARLYSRVFAPVFEPILHRHVHSGAATSVADKPASSELSRHVHSHRCEHAAGVFNLRENDYCFGKLKFAGNAQSISRQRFCHHTSFLWDMDQDHMAKYLRIPERAPEYRGGRAHADFLCKLKDAFSPIPNHHEVHRLGGHHPEHKHDNKHPPASPSDVTPVAITSDVFFYRLRESLEHEFQVEDVPVAEALNFLNAPHQSSSHYLQPGKDY